MNEERKLSQTMVEHENITQFAELLQFDFVRVSTRLEREHFGHCGEHEQRLCALLMVVEFIKQHGFVGPAMGRFQSQLPGKGWLVFYGVLGDVEDPEEPSYLDFYLPEEVD